MVFGTQTILSSKNNNCFSKQESSIVNDVSFFSEALQCIIEENKIFHSTMYKLNEGIVLEGAGTDLLKAAIKKIDPIKILKNILDWFMNLLNKLFKEFEAFILSTFSKDRVINRYKDKIKSYNKPVYYGEDRYTYTNLGTNTSYTSYKNEIDKEFSSLILRLNKLRSFKDYESLYSEISIIKDEFSFREDYFCLIRGNIVGERNSIRKEEFGSKLFNFFRNDGYVISPSEISPSEYKSLCDSYFNYRSMIKSIEKDKSDMINESRKVQKDIMSIKLEDYIRPNITPDGQKVFLSLLENKASRIKFLCDIYLQVFSAKMDAAKESHIQTKKILLEVCKAIVKEDGNND